MVYLKNKDVGLIIEKLSNNPDKKLKNILKKLKSAKKRLVYVKDKSEIRKLLKKAFNERRKIKIRYYSPHSDEVTTRIVDIYQMHIDSIIAYCHLRKDERTFAIGRIISAAILNEKYSAPKNWSPESIY